MPELAIEPAAFEHLDGIARIEQESFPTPWRRDFFESELIADWRFNLVARRGRVVVGYLFAMWLFDEMHVNKIAVTAVERRKGIADALMERAFAFADEHAIRIITLEVRMSNEGAQAFYRRLQFASTYVRPRYYPDGEAAVVMTRTL